MGFCVCGADDYDDDWQRWDDHPARRQWEPLKDLGSGALSQVVLARHRTTGEYAALKVVFLESPAVADDPEHLALLERESDLLGMLEHPHIVECKDVIRSPRQLVLVLEWLHGGQVIDRLHELGLQYSEQQAAAVFAQAAEAVAHLHEYRILHRDIKPENVMFAEPPVAAQAPPVVTAADLQGGRAGGGGGGGGKGAAAPRMPTVKLVDLGMACLYDPDKPQRGPLGSPGFVAPEVIADGVHTPAMDVFSLGALLFIMLVGRKPFNIKESENLRYALMSLQEAPGLKDPRWLDLSPDAKHLVMGMLCYDPARRLTIQQVLQHEWVVSRGGILPRPLGADVVFGARTVASIRRLRNLCGGVVAFNRAAAVATAGGGAARGGSARSGAPADSAKDAYLRRLRQSQRLENSSRGGSVFKRMAASIAGSAYTKAHDAGGSVHPADDASVRRGGRSGSAAGSAAGDSMRGRFGALPWRRGSNAALQGGSMHGTSWQATPDPSTSRRTRYAALLPGGLTRAGTAVVLSEMDRTSWSPSLSCSGSRGALQGQSLAALNAGSAPGGAAARPPVPPLPLERKPSALQLLSSAARVYLKEGSSHGGSWRGASAFAPPAPGSGSGSSGPGALRQVADESSAQAARKQLAAVTDASTSSSSSASSRSFPALGMARGGSGALLDAAEGRQRGKVAAALAAGVPPERVSTLMVGSRSGSLHGVGSPVQLPPRPASAAGACPSPRPAAAPGDHSGSSTAAGSAADPGSSRSRSSFEELGGLRPHRVVQRRSLENPLMQDTASPVPSRTWADMQAHLRQQTPSSASRSRSREGTLTGTPSTRVVRIKPLE